MEASDLARKSAEIFSHDVDRVIEHGNNTGDHRIWEYQQTVHITPGQPYCAAAVSTVIKEGAAELGIKPIFKPSSRAMGLIQLNSALLIPLEELTPECLPCVGVVDHGPFNAPIAQRKGHAFFIVGMDESGKLQTIEANTNGQGDRDGQGVRALNIRHVSQLAGAIRIV